MSAISRLAIVGLLLAASPPAEAAASWTRVRSTHFTFVGDASPRDLRQTAERLEQFRDVMLRALPRAAADSPVPTVVVVFKDDVSLTPYKPLYQGRPIAITGYFQAGLDVNYIVVNANLGDAAFDTVFHEYSHFLTGNTMGIPPVWLNEGLAQVYQTFETRSGGKSALIGQASADYVRLLRRSSLMPLGELLAVDWLSPTYNEGDRRTVFYAQSWALVHYLMLANGPRTGQFSRYVGLLTRGVGPDSAFTQAFGADRAALERELQDYIRKFAFPAVRFDFDEKIALGTSGQAEPIDDVEANAYLGDLLARTRRVDEARGKLSALHAANPESGRAALNLGLLELRDGHPDLALPLIESAASQMPGDESAQLALGAALLERLRQLERGSDVANDVIARARRALARSLELSPNLAHTLATFGQLELLIGDDLPKGVAYLDRAARLVPSREAYRLLLGTGLIRLGEYDRAQTMLGPLIAMGSSVEVRESARRLLRAMAVRIQEDRDLAAEQAAAASDTTPPARSTTAAAEPEPSPWQLSTPPLRQNQGRVIGELTAVECQAGAVVFAVQAGGRTVRLRAASVTAVEFVTYRSDAPRSISCGAMAQPWLVQATYQLPAASGIDGQALLVEILPEGYPVR